jgi:hypothetical protein
MFLTGWLRLIYVFLVSFFNFYFYFIIQHRIGWKLGFVIFFLFAFYSVILICYDLGYHFDKLTRVDSDNFFVFFLFNISF